MIEAQPAGGTERKMPRVVLLTSPSLMGARIIETFAAHPGLSLVGVGLTNRVFKNTGLVGTIRRVLKRSGWSYFYYSVLESTVAWGWLNRRKLPRGLHRQGMSVRPVTDVNGGETLDWLRELGPDLVVSFFFNQWIGAEVCGIPTRGCVNIHPSALPAFRGPDPIFRGLERGVTRMGITIHAVADEFDAGTILDQCEQPFDPKGSHFQNLWRLVTVGSQWAADWLAGESGETRTSARLVEETTRSSASATVKPVPSGNSADYATFPKTAEVRAFLRAGHRLYRWSEISAAMRSLRDEPEGRDR